MTETPGESRAGQARRVAPRTQWVLIGLCALAVVVVVVFGAVLRNRAATPAAPGAATSTALRLTERQWQSLTLQAARPRAFADTAATDGKIAADDDLTTSVYSPYSGRVTRIFVRAGDHVAAGAALFAIDAQEIVQGQGDLAATAAQVKLASAVEARQHELYEGHGAALKDWQQSQADLINAQAAYRAARDRLRILGLSDVEIDALADRPTAVAPRRETLVRAPRAGVVMQRNLSVGQNIASLTNGGTAAAFVISDLSKVWLVGELREVQAPSARVGQPVEMTVTALPGRTFSGRLDFVAPSVDPVSRRVAVRATVPNPEERLKPEMFADFSVITGANRNSVAVPADAVIYEGDAARVWVARAADRSVALRQVTTGRTANGDVEVLSGLAPGEVVVTSGSLFIDRAARGG